MYYTVIAHDFDLDFFVGSKSFDSIDEAKAFAADITASESDSVTVWVQGSDGSHFLR